MPALPKDHSPTLFLAGAGDPSVPLWTVPAYSARLLAEGHKTQLIVRGPASPEWIPEAPSAVIEWFRTSP